MIKLLIITIVLAAIGVAVRAIKPKTTISKTWPKGILDVNHSF